MADPVDHDAVILQFKQNPVIPDMQTVFRYKIRELLDIAFQTIAHLFDVPDDFGLGAYRQRLNVLYSSNLPWFANVLDYPW